VRLRGALFRPLDGCKLPVRARLAHEGPDLRGFGGLAVVAADHPTAATLDHRVDRGVAHGKGCVVRAVFPPRLGNVALQKFHIRDQIADAVGGILTKLHGQVGHRFWRRQATQRCVVLAAVGGLDFGQQRLKAVEVALFQP
jgi:hypothetical protein